MATPVVQLIRNSLKGPFGLAYDGIFFDQYDYMPSVNRNRTVYPSGLPDAVERWLLHEFPALAGPDAARRGAETPLEGIQGGVDTQDAEAPLSDTDTEGDVSGECP